jgi:hypothetical protein
MSDARRGICEGCRKVTVLTVENGRQCADCREHRVQTFDRGQRSPWAVLCPVHGRVFLESDEYGRQMSRGDVAWSCPAWDSEESRFGLCGYPSIWDDDTHEDTADPHRVPDTGGGS